MTAQDRPRIDLWLKLVCLFKHRSEATEACKGGLVKINGQRVKPAAVIREGDVVEFTAGTRERKVVVQQIPERQASKEQARAMYLDQSPEPPKAERPAVQRERGAGRPTKRERREIDRLRR